MLYCIIIMFFTRMSYYSFLSEIISSIDKLRVTDTEIFLRYAGTLIYSFSLRPIFTDIDVK